MNYRSIIAAAAAVISVLSCSRTLRDGDYTLTVLSTNDVHGTWFDSSYVNDTQRQSLFAINYYIDSVRTADGFDNVLLVDAGDCLQGDNAAYYYNYVDTASAHLFPRLLEYMRYDAVAVGNHDVETGHPVYDRVAADLRRAGADFLGGNAVRTDNGKPYFPLYKTVRKAGLKIAILGYTNANIRAWISEDLFSGMDFVPIADIIQRDVDFVRKKERPDVVVATMHSACGLGDGTILEAEALDALNSVRGVDFLVCGHDHRPYVETRDTCALLNSGSHSRFVAHGKMHIRVESGKVVSKSFESDLIPVDAKKADPVMREAFRKDFEAVKSFSTRVIGSLDIDLYTRDAYRGMCPYIDLVHTVSLRCKPAEISFAAPLTYNGFIAKGPLAFNDLFTLYPYENQLYVVQMSGQQIKDYLEVSYGKWIRTVESRRMDHILNIEARDDSRTGQGGWSFVERSYNFDSAAGINYTVDVTKPFGERIVIASMADGTPFELTRKYNVAMTSYRASGGGDLLRETGIGSEEVAELTVEKYPEIRSIMYDFLLEKGKISPETVSDRSILGSWKFVPEAVAGPAMDRDMDLMFSKR